MNFQRYVIIFFVVLLLIIMIFLGVTMSNNKATNVPWPPIISNCPDYWIDTPDEPIPEFITVCTETKTYGKYNEDPNKIEPCTNTDNDPECILIGTVENCHLIPNPDIKDYITYITKSDGTSVHGKWQTYNDNNNTTIIKNIETGYSDFGTLIHNPDYTSIPIPHVPGSRCIGTIGQNTGNYTKYDPKNSGCIWDGTNYTANCKTKKTTTVDFTSTGLNYIGANGECQKQGWAINSGNISWDGITYGYGENNPC